MGDIVNVKKRENKHPVLRTHHRNGMKLRFPRFRKKTKSQIHHKNV